MRGKEGKERGRERERIGGMVRGEGREGEGKGKGRTMNREVCWLQLQGYSLDL